MSILLRVLLLLQLSSFSLSASARLVSRPAIGASSIHPRIVPPATRPVNIAHRGASGVLPEHALAAYQRAIDDGADYVECDVTLCKDLVPVCMHENALSGTTDVASHEEFADKKRTLTYQDDEGVWHNETDWFAMDFLLSELKTLRRIQPMSYRDPSFNGLYPIVTLQEYIDVVKAANRSVGIYPEIKEPVLTNKRFFNNTEHRFEDMVLDVLASNGYTSADSNCLIQCFTESSLDYVLTRTPLRLVMLIQGTPTNETLDSWGTKFHGVGANTEVIAQYNNEENGYKNWISYISNFVQRAHDRQLQVHVWTLRNEDRYLAWDFEQDVYMAFEFFVGQQVDGLFTDFPQALTNYLDQLYAPRSVDAAVISAHSAAATFIMTFKLTAVLTSFAAIWIIY